MPTPRLPWWRRWFGQRSERYAERFLQTQGHRILTRNWSCSLGELDLITRQGNILVFVEVRSTSHQDGDSALQSVDRAKQARLSRLALAFMKQYRLFDVPTRFDVVILAWPEQTTKPTIQYFQNAFTALGKESMFG